MSLVKDTIKRLLRFTAASLPPRYLRKIVHRSPARLLHAFNHEGLRDKYIAEISPDYKLWDVTYGKDGHMIQQGCDCVSLAEQYGTPLYVVDKKRLEKNYRDFSESFSKLYPNVEVAYSYKTNPLPGAIKALHEFGALAEVVSPFELWLALKLGVPPDKIIYNGPEKREDGLRMAVTNNIKLINIDGLTEIETIDRLAGQCGNRQQVGVRVVTSVGWKSKFGFSIVSGAAFDIFQSLKRYHNIIPCGLHFHLGTGIGNTSVYLQAIEETLELAMRLKRDLNIDIKYFDFGGGFNNVATVRAYSDLENMLLKENLPVQEMQIQDITPITEYSQAILKLFSRYYPLDRGELPTIILEPGRAITGNAQHLLLKVLEVKSPKDGLSEVIMDGGRGIASPLGWEFHEVLNASRMHAPKVEYYTLFGPTCTPYDVLYQIKKLPTITQGDVLAIMDTGAYFIPMQCNFSFPRAAAVMIENGHHQLIRKREAFDSIVAQDLPVSGWATEQSSISLINGKSIS